MKKWVTLEEYLRNELPNGVDFDLRAERTEDDRIVFYIHPAARDGETADFEVHGNGVEHNQDIQ